MTLIPDRLPEAIAPAQAVSKRSGKSGDASFVRVMERLRQTGPRSQTGNAAADGAEIFNERGFFQPPLASPNPPTVDASAREKYAIAQGNPVQDADPLVGQAAQTEPCNMVRTAADTRDRIETPVRTRSTRAFAKAAKGSAAAPMTRSNAFISSRSAISRPEAAVIRQRNNAGTANATANVAVIAHDTGRDVCVSARIDGLDPGRRAKLRTAIVGLLARHGLLPGQVRINGALAMPPEQENT